MDTPISGQAILELLDEHDFTRWEEVNLSDKASDWLTQADTIVQRNDLHHRKYARGSLLLRSIPDAFDVRHISLQFTPGKVHQAGLVFNFVDRANFSLFLVDQHSEAYEGYEVIIAEVLEGDFRFLNREKYLNERDSVLTFSLVVTEEGLEFALGSEQIFTIPGWGIKAGSRLGLYNQGDTLAQYTSLWLGNFLDETNEDWEDLPTGFEEVPPVRSAVKADVSDELSQSLKLKPAQSKTQIEFTESMVVPFDSYYTNLYQHASLYDMSQAGKPVREPETYDLDFRPKRWYQDLQVLMESEQDAKHAAATATKHKSYFQSKLDNLAEPSMEEIDQLNLEIEQTERRYQGHRSAIFTIREQKSALLREIRSNGYAINHEDIPQDIQDQGYRFFMLGGKPRKVTFEPLVVDPEFDFYDDDAWKILDDKLRAKVLDSAFLTEESKARFVARSNELFSKSGSVLLQNRLTKISKDLQAHHHQLDRKKVEKRNALNRLKFWDHDRAMIGQRSGESTDYKASVKRVYDFAVDIVPRFKIFKALKKRTKSHRTADLWFLDVRGGRSYGMARCSTKSVTAWKLRFSIFNTDSGYIGYKPFLKRALAHIDHYKVEEARNRDAADRAIQEVQNKIKVFNSNLQELERHGLAQLRVEFLEQWNRAEAMDQVSYETRVIAPDSDPLADLLVDLNGGVEGTPSAYRTYFMQMRNDGLYTQEGQRYQDFMESRLSDREKTLIVLPILDNHRRISDEQFMAIVDPVPPVTHQPELPHVKILETYRTEIVWKGYALGELSHSFNLFPGEQKELVIQNSTQLARSEQDSTTESGETSSKQTSSFENRLESSLEDNHRVQHRNEKTARLVKRAKSEDTKSSKKAKSLEVPSYGVGSAKISDETRRETKKTSEQEDGNEEKTINDQSRDLLSKEVKQTIAKTAHETSQNNKVEVSSQTSASYEYSSEEKEVIKLENPNLGRTINYHFFQLQNVYEVTTKLVDVKLMVDPGVSIVNGSNLSDVRIYELEEFGKIYAKQENPNLPTPPHTTLLAAILCRKLFKLYGDFMPGFSGSGAIQIDEFTDWDPEIFEWLNFSFPERGEFDLKNELIPKLEKALDQLKAIPFKFRETTLVEKLTYAINCGALHLESNLGMEPAIENYLKDMRDIEKDKSRSLVDEIKARTQQGVFFRDLPDRDQVVAGHRAPDTLPAS